MREPDKMMICFFAEGGKYFPLGQVLPMLKMRKDAHVNQ